MSVHVEWTDEHQDRAGLDEEKLEMRSIMLTTMDNHM